MPFLSFVEIALVAPVVRTLVGGGGGEWDSKAWACGFSRIVFTCPD
jgi:hypothetical protein